MQNEAWHCPAEIDMEFQGKVVVLTAASVSPNPNISLHINGTFTYMQITHAVALMHPHTITDGWFLHFSLVTVWMIFFIFGTVESNVRFPPKTSWNLDSSDQRTRLSVHLRWLQVQRTRRRFCAKLINAFLCIIQFQVAFLDAAADCVEWQWFSKVLQSPCGYVHHGSMTVSQTILPEGSMVTRIQQQFLPLAFTHKDSLNSFTILWAVDGERPKFFAILRWETLSLKLTDNSLTKFGTKWWTMTHPCLQRLSLWWMLFVYSILITSPVTS